jgi:nucleoside-diphosphate-sugar epimerase
MKTAIVTGSAGFIGGHLSEKLLKEGYRVVGIDNMRSGLESTMELHISYDAFVPKYYDITTDRIESVFMKFMPDIVFHLAAIPGVAPSVKDPLLSNNTNVNGTVNILSMSQKYNVKRVVFSSSSSVYGGSEVLPTPENTPLNPKSPYALQKRIGEEYCKLFSKVYGLDTVCLRYFNVFGPRQRADSEYAAVISAFCDSVKNNVRPTIYGDGEQSRDFCFVDNVVHANILAATCDIGFSGDVFNVGCGGRITVNSICDALDTRGPIYKPERLGDVRHSQADISKAHNVLGYKPLVTYSEGLEETLDWYLKE